MLLRRLAVALIVASMAAGVSLALLGRHTLRWSPPPIPPRAMAGRPRCRRPSGSRHTVPAPATPGVRAAADGPVPAGVAGHPGHPPRARVIPLGQALDGGPAVPSLSTPLLTSWYDRGPTPGSAGTAIIFGHVDAATVGPAVFYNLGRCAAATWST